MASALSLQQYKTVYDYYITNASVTVQLAPMATSYTHNPATDAYWSDISASLASGASLITLNNFAVNIDAGNLRVEFDSDDVSEASQTFTSDKCAIVFSNTGATSTWPVFGVFDYSNGTLSPVNGIYAVTVPADGYAALNDK